MQVNYGEHNSTVHVEGFLKHNLQDFVPKHLLPSKQPKEWESLIFKAHAKISGKSIEDAKTEYIGIVKQWPLYGATFFPPCKMLNKSKHGKIIIGVNAEGILLLKAKVSFFLFFTINMIGINVDSIGQRTDFYTSLYGRLLVG